MRTCLMLLLSLLLVSLLLSLSLGEKETPYEVLGVSITADKLQIKKAYSKLARKWHPDKNRSPEASDKMARINWAYKILHNDDKRRRYDILGEESDDAPPSNKPDTRNYLTPTDSVSSMQFMNHLKSYSKKRPYLIYYYHDFCPACLSWTEKWEELRTDFLRLGLGTASIQVIISTQATQFSRVQLNKVPALGLLVDEEVHLYTGAGINMEDVKEFVNPLVRVKVNEVVSSDFLYGGNVSRITNNKPVVLLASVHPSPSLSYKLIALKLQSFCDFYFLSSSRSSQELLDDLRIERDGRALFIYKDISEQPHFILNSIDSKGAVTAAIDENKLLLLPRVSSPLFFDTICPFGPHARLCLLLVANGVSQYTDPLTNSFRQLAYEWKDKDVSMGYFDINRQTSLSNKFSSSVESSLKKCNNGYSSRTILVLHREKADKAHYKLFHNYCGEDNKELEEILSLGDRTLNKLMVLDPVEDESITFWSQLIDALPRVWEKTMAIFLLPFPLFILSCYLYYFNDTRPQGGNQQLQQNYGQRTQESHHSQQQRDQQQRDEQQGDEQQGDQQQGDQQQRDQQQRDEQQRDEQQGDQQQGGQLQKVGQLERHQIEGGQQEGNQFPEQSKEKKQEEILAQDDDDNDDGKKPKGNDKELTNEKKVEPTVDNGPGKDSSTNSKSVRKRH
ncbi:PREDICTED: dnaJ homolog subfamily C member 16-like isoform X2 [Amphimedon queenslandica]|uniref:DnaJ homolog subfamily C member 16 n=1 Tax=Amphimedon queenslandica TaxID=400682 RepID=A0AAN0J0D6_AMPQE|nr:PREDICTED: dnaJ homolog subfamily C member 16-like isoform X2 [Amphimedon queenslandica]|eukprot:XP_019850178.1 PREDICTED: dnaJ homolog subfamily C member 16-like isoform X2 [Amphimedon queenslandica]